MKKTFIIISILLFSLSIFGATARIKDIANFRGARDNQLFGIGLVTGLNGTGDSSTVPSEMMSNIMKSFNIELKSKFSSKNSAIVMVFADIPSFYKEGMKLTVTVAAIGDAKTLEGGVLLQTPLSGADQIIYAVAQGNVLTGGKDVKGTTNLQTKYKVVGTIPDGAIVEKEIPAKIVSDNTVTINLNQPDISTAAKISLAINNSFAEKIAKAIDPSSITVKIPPMFNDDLISFLSLVEEIEVQPDSKARIILDEKTGTIVLGGKVKLSDFTINYGNFVITVKNGKVVDKIKDEAGKVSEKELEATIDRLIMALKNAGAIPQDIIAIIQNLSRAGYIYAEIVLI